MIEGLILILDNSPLRLKSQKKKKNLNSFPLFSSAPRFFALLSLCKLQFLQDLWLRSNLVRFGAIVMFASTVTNQLGWKIVCFFALDAIPM